jgi:hypothetical protein
VGCGVLPSGEVYFTLNGVFLGKVPNPIKDDTIIYATVSSRGEGAKVQFNFDKPFKFNPQQSNQINFIKYYKNVVYSTDDLKVVFEGFSTTEIVEIFNNKLTDDQNDTVAVLLHALTSYKPKEYDNIGKSKVFNKLLKNHGEFCTSVLSEALSRFTVVPLDPQPGPIPSPRNTTPTIPVGGSAPASSAPPIHGESDRIPQNTKKVLNTALPADGINGGMNPIIKTSIKLFFRWTGAYNLFKQLICINFLVFCFI